MGLERGRGRRSRGGDAPASSSSSSWREAVDVGLDACEANRELVGQRVIERQPVLRVWRNGDDTSAHTPCRVPVLLFRSARHHARTPPARIFSWRRSSRASFIPRRSTLASSNRLKQCHICQKSMLGISQNTARRASAPASHRRRVQVRAFTVARCTMYVSKPRACTCGFQA